MSRSKPLFRQSDLTKAIKAAEKAGYKPQRAVVRPNEIVVDFSEPDTTVVDSSEWAKVK